MEYWENWWIEKKKALEESPYLQSIQSERKLEREEVLNTNAGLVNELDWPALIAGYPGLDKWKTSNVMPALIVNIDGEFGFEGVMLRTISEKRYFFSRAKDRPDRPLILGFQEAQKSIWEKGYVIAVEGYFDWVAVKKYEKNTIATLTDNISPSLAKVLVRYADVVGVMTDNDNFGKLGALKSQKRVEYAGASAVQIEYTRGKDPGELREQNSQELERILSKYRKNIEWMVGVKRLG